MSAPKLDLAALKRIAEAATPGEWTAEEWCGTEGGWCAIGPHHEATEGEDYDDAPGSDCHARAQRDSVYIAAANPATLLQLIERLERAEALLRDVHCDPSYSITAELDDRIRAHLEDR